MEFHQKKYLKKKSFFIEDGKLTVHSSSASGNYKYSIPFEEIGLDKIYKSYPAYAKYILFAVWFLIVGSALYAQIFHSESMKPNTFWVILALYSPITFILYLSMNKNNIYLTSAKHTIEFFADRPNKSEVEAFIDSLIQEVKFYIKKKYLVFNAEVPEDMIMGNAFYLKNSNIITQEEYDEFVSEYKTRKIL